MNRLKILLSVFCLVALTLTIAGCGLIGAYRASSDINGSLQQDLPEWLTVAHRAQMEIQPAEEPEENGLETNADRIPVVNQPASPLPDSTQPAPQPSPQPGGTPRWQQPGTMEYITKLQLDQYVHNYKVLNTQIDDYDGEDATFLKNLKKDRSERYKLMSEIATGIGLSLDKEYGIKAPPAEPSATPSSTWFYDQDHSPSGFGN